MPKRVFALLFLLMLLVGGRAQAGDIPESILDGRHIAMFIGQITGIGGDTMAIPGVETAQPSLTELSATGAKAAAQNQTGITNGTGLAGTITTAEPEREASGGATRPEQDDHVTLVVTIVLAVLAVGGGLVMLSNEVARKKAKKNSGAQDRSQPGP